MTVPALGPGSISAHELDGLLADLQLDDAPAPPAEILLDDETHAALDVAIERIEAYEGQASDQVVSEIVEPEVKVEIVGTDSVEAAAAPAPVSTPRAKKASSPKTGIARVTSDLSALPAEAFRLIIGGSVDDDHKTAVMKLRPAQKKVGEKFDNVIGAVAAGKRPSVFVMIAFKVLQAKSEITTNDIVAALRTTYTEGTARSQAGQMMELFHALGIGTRDRSRKTLTLNAESAFAHKLATLATA